MHVTKWKSDNSLVGITTDVQHNVVYFTCRRHGIWKLNITDLSCVPSQIVDNSLIDACGIVHGDNNFLYVCDKTNHYIYQYNIENNDISTLAGVGYNSPLRDMPMIEAPLDTPDGITIDNNGNLYVAERSTIRKININDKTVETLFELVILNYDYFTSVAELEDGTVFYSAGTDIHMIQNGESLWVAGVSFSAEGLIEHRSFDWIHALGMDGEDIVVCDNADVIRRVDVNNTITNIQTHKPIFAPSCIVGANNGILYVGTRTGEILKLEDMWYVERLLWIGNLKENSRDCHLAALPRDIIKEILGVMRE